MYSVLKTTVMDSDKFKLICVFGDVANTNLNRQTMILLSISTCLIRARQTIVKYLINLMSKYEYS